MLDFNDLLKRRNFEPESIIVLRHRPFEPELARVLPWLAAEHPDLFNAYQQTQGEKLEGAMLKARYVAAFIGHGPGKALFAGFYAIGPAQRLSHDELWSIKSYRQLAQFGMRGFTPEDAERRKTICWFDLQVDDFLSAWKGRLVIGWPPPERSWWRRAERNTLPVLAVLEDSAFEAAMPSWENIDLSWAALSAIPAKWQSALSQWRGIYFIFDAADGKGYVGSACGSDNILGRWRDYARSGHGGNKLLKGRDPSQMRFSILQRVSPDYPVEDVVRLEATWKARLHTSSPYGLNDN
jgi:hypothetical protein